MRGTVSEKLSEFLSQVAQAATLARQNGVEITPELTRQNLENLRALIPDGPNLALIKDQALQSPAHRINTRIYHPDPTQPLAVLLHFHGGGHMCGSLDLYDPICRELAMRTNSIVIAVDYRLAPEFPYPCGIEDCQFVLQNYKQLLAGLAFDEQRLSIAGDSAGGAICTTLVMKNIEQPSVTIDSQVLIYPSVDYTLTSESIDSNGQGYLLEAAKVAWYFDAYFAQKSTDMEYRKNASPLHGQFSNAMPRTLIFTAGCDPLRDEGIAYAKAMKNVGAQVSHHHLDGMVHAYMLLHNLVKEECEQTYDAIEQFFNSNN